MLKVNSYSTKGAKLAAVVLPKEFEVKPNLNLLAQAIRVYEDRQHPRHASTKTRGEINRTTKKWYKQKGTGGARHGARSAPIFVGGGISHGPQPVKRELTLSQGIKQKSLRVALSIRAKEGKVVVVSGLSGIKKTKEAQALVDKVIKDGSRRVTFVLADTLKDMPKSFRNIKNSKVLPFRSLNAYEIFFGGMIILDKQSLASFTGKDVFGKTKTKETK